MAWSRREHQKVSVKTVDLPNSFRMFIVTQPKFYGTLFSERAKILFNQKDYTNSLNAYSMAIVYSYDLEFLARMLCNRSLVHLKLKNFYKAYIDASEAIGLDSTLSKIILSKTLFRKGKALAELGCFSKARESYKKAWDLKEDLDISIELAAIQSKEDNLKINEKLLMEYDPLCSDPPEFGRERFTGELNRYLLNGKKFVSKENCEKFKYDPKTWKSAEDLVYTFIDLAVEERVAKKNFWMAINCANIVQALDLEPNPHICIPACIMCCPPAYLFDGPDPMLSFFRAESFFQLGELGQAYIGYAYTQNRFGPIRFNNQSNVYSWILLELFQTMISHKAGDFTTEIVDLNQVSEVIKKYKNKGVIPSELVSKLNAVVNEISKDKQQRYTICPKYLASSKLDTTSPDCLIKVREFVMAHDGSELGVFAEKLFSAGRNAWASIFPNEIALAIAKKKTEELLKI